MERWAPRGYIDSKSQSYECHSTYNKGFAHIPKSNLDTNVWGLGHTWNQYKPWLPLVHIFFQTAQMDALVYAQIRVQVSQVGVIRVSWKKCPRVSDTDYNYKVSDGGLVSVRKPSQE